MGNIISVANNKGGCGKSTITYNLADALGRKGRRVLVIDMDPQCNTTSILLPENMPVQKSLHGILDPKAPPEVIDSFIYPTECKNVVLIPNIAETSRLEPAMTSRAPDCFLDLREQLRAYVAKNHDTVIIDTPPNMGPFVRCALYSSDFVMIPIRAGSSFSVEGLIKATHLIGEVQEKGNPDLRFLRLLINGLDKRTAICKALRAQIRQTFDKDQIFETEIPANTSFERAEATRETIFQFDGRAPGAMAFRKLAEEFISVTGG
ncbi:MAG: ParA family protein [Deltaproteobacteria bacterium]|nr:ParA family protein [Deltaproteobacteria bacterium]